MSETTPSTLEKALQKAVQLERMTGTLYLQFTRLFDHHPEICQFWKEYATEEEEHAAYLEKLREGLPEHRRKEPVDPDLDRRLNHCLQKMGEISPEKILTLRDAHQLAVEIENSETNSIFEFFVLHLSPDHSTSHIEFLREQLNDHLQRLESDFPEAYRGIFAQRNTLAHHKNQDKTF